MAIVQFVEALPPVMADLRVGNGDSLHRCCMAALEPGPCGGSKGSGLSIGSRCRVRKHRSWAVLRRHTARQRDSLGAFGGNLRLWRVVFLGPTMSQRGHMRTTCQQCGAAEPNVSKWIDQAVVAV
eukprot:s1900_g10.t1